MQPGPEGRVAAELAQRAEGSQVGVLEHVAGVVLVSHKAQRQGIAVGRRGAYEVFEGGPVPVPGELYESGEVVVPRASARLLVERVLPVERQYFFISIRSRSFCLFFVVM